MTTRNSPSPAVRQSIRIFAQFMVALVLLYLLNRYLAYWHHWPGLAETLRLLTGNAANEADQTFLVKSIGLWFIYIAVFILILWNVTKRCPFTPLRDDSTTFAQWSYYIVRAGFWSVLLIGIADATISLMRVEAIAPPAWVNQEWWASLDRARERGLTVHYPLMAFSLVLAWFTRSLNIIWLSLLVVLSEFAIVISRFIFSYEQAFMGDLVRFWYAALFLFASASTLVQDGHVRVDVLYANFSPRTKAWVNAIGSLLLGLPLCWVILTMGMGTPQSSLISPILSFETSQSSYGMYVQYLMAGFLIVFAVSMAIIFVSYFLNSLADIMHEAPRDAATNDELAIPAGKEEYA